MSRSYFLLSTLILFSINTILFGQSRGINRENYRINIYETDNPINTDGILDEPVWQSVDKTSQFHRVLPTDTGFAK